MQAKFGVEKLKGCNDEVFCLTAERMKAYLEFRFRKVVLKNG